MWGGVSEFVGEKEGRLMVNVGDIIAVRGNVERVSVGVAIFVQSIY